MKTKTGLSLGLALTLMVGVFATMLALGLFTANEVRAAAVVDLSVASTVNTIDDRTQITVTFDTATLLPAEGTIKVVFPDTMVVPSFIEDDTKLAASPSKVTVGGAFAESATKGQTITVTNPTEIAAGVGVTVVFPIQETADTPAKMVGIQNPNVVEDYVVMVSTSADEDVESFTITGVTEGTPGSRSDLYGLSVTHEPEGTNANAKITVDFYSPMALSANLDTITVVFHKDVQVPALLDERFISVVGEDSTGAKTVANPLDVTVTKTGTPANKPTVTVTLGDHNPDQDVVGGVAAGPVSVIFRQGAGIKNPTAAGTFTVTVSTNEYDEGVASTAGRSLNTKRILALSNSKGKRGSTATATGSGFKDGTTATVWLEKPGSTDNVQDAGEPTLCTGDVAKDDTFTCDFVIGASFDTGKGKNSIQAKDGTLAVADAAQTWTVSSQVKAVPQSAAIGEKVTIQIRDYGADSSDGIEITLGGIAITPDGSYSYDDGSADIPIVVPNGVALRIQTLKVALGDDKPTTNMTILGAQLEISSSMVVPNQSVTITGRGFSTDSDAEISDPVAKKLIGTKANESQILIGGEPIINWDKINAGEPIEIDSGGSWVADIVIPVNEVTVADGTYELKVIDSKGRPGVTSITVPGRTVEFDPLVSRVGTTLTVSGTGWLAANNAVGSSNADIDLEYTSGSNAKTTSRATPDANGAFAATIKVPLNASIPSTNRIEITYEVPIGSNQTIKVTETEAHRVPGAEMTLSPVSGPGGTLVTMSGSGFKAFTSLGDVTVGGLTVTPRPAGASVGRDGVLENVQVLIPALDPGTHTVRAEVGGEQGATVSAAFTITADDAVPAATAEDTTPDVAFKELIDSGSLLTVFWYNEDTQSYLSYDPDPANAGFNDLETVGSGDIFWVRLSEDANFLGKLRRAEWAQVVLP